MGAEVSTSRQTVPVDDTVITQQTTKTLDSAVTQPYVTAGMRRRHEMLAQLDVRVLKKLLAQPKIPDAVLPIFAAVGAVHACLSVAWSVNVLIHVSLLVWSSQLCLVLGESTTVSTMRSLLSRPSRFRQRLSRMQPHHVSERNIKLAKQLLSHVPLLTAESVTDTGAGPTTNTGVPLASGPIQDQLALVSDWLHSVLGGDADEDDTVVDPGEAMEARQRAAEELARAQAEEEAARTPRGLHPLSRPVTAEHVVPVDSKGPVSASAQPAPQGPAHAQVHAHHQTNPLLAVGSGTGAAGTGVDVGASEGGAGASPGKHGARSSGVRSPGMRPTFALTDQETMALLAYVDRAELLNLVQRKDLPKALVPLFAAVRSTLSCNEMRAVSHVVELLAWLRLVCC